MPIWLKAGLWAALLMPLGIVLHEGAHYLAYVAYDLPGPSLSYAYGGFEGMQEFWSALKSGDREAALAIASIEDVGMTALAGVLFTFVAGGIGLGLLALRGSLFGGALAMTFLFRPVTIALLYATGSPQNTDEAHVEITLGFPGIVLMLVGTAGFVAAFALTVRQFGWVAGLVMLMAMGASLALWMTTLGPLLLP